MQSQSFGTLSTSASPNLAARADSARPDPRRSSRADWSRSSSSPPAVGLVLSAATPISAAERMPRGEERPDRHVGVCVSSWQRNVARLEMTFGVGSDFSGEDGDVAISTKDASASADRVCKSRLCSSWPLKVNT